MRKPRLFRWRNLEQTSGLLFFAQKIEESLFDYSVDTYKVPALNTRSRCLELVRSIDQVKSGQLTSKSLQSIVEELAWSIGEDIAARSLLGSLAPDFKSSDAWRLDDLQQLTVKATLLKGKLAGGAYLRELVGQIKSRLTEVPQRRNEISDLTASLIVEWTNRGFSRGFIFMRTKTFFFSPSGSKIDSVDLFESFVKLFEGKERSHDVLTRIHGSAALLPELLPDGRVSIHEGVPERKTKSNKEEAFFREHDARVFVTFHDVKALDSRSALNRALVDLDILSRLVAFHAHKDRLVATGDALVYCEQSVARLRETPLAVHKDGDIKPGALTEACLRTLTKFFAPRVDKTAHRRIMAALGLHSSAVSIKDTSVQLTTLWSALEALLPIAADQVKISLVVENLAPVLCRRYPMRLLAQLESDLRLCCPEVYDEVMAQLPHQVPEHLKCAALVAIDENEKLRVRLYETLDNNPLLQNRIYKLKNQLDSADRILKLINRHRMKATWHIRRIYRLRNLVTHAGQTSPYMGPLVENLHSYFHRLVEAVEECLSPPQCATDIDSALLACRLEDSRHQSFLTENRKTKISMDNLARFMGGPVFAETMPVDQRELRANDQSSDM